MNSIGRWAHFATLPTFLSGGIYLWMKYFMKGSDPYSVIHHPLQPAILKIHILSAPFLLLVLGGVMFLHVLPAISAGYRLGKRSGWFNFLLIFGMVFSGYLLQVFTNEKTLSVTAYIHIGAGLLFVLTLVAHQWATRKS